MTRTRRQSDDPLFRPDGGSWVLPPSTGWVLERCALPRPQRSRVVRAATGRSRSRCCDARELGVNHFDTAAFYFSPRRSANELINAAFPDHDEDIVVATKVGPARNASGEWVDPARPNELRGHVEENLRQLGRDRLEIVYLRVFGSGSPSSHTSRWPALVENGAARSKRETT